MTRVFLCLGLGLEICSKADQACYWLALTRLARRGDRA